MIKNLSKEFIWLKSNINIINIIGRGIERETLRIMKNGKLSIKEHPITLGKPLTHPWISTDFAESLLEFITPVHYNVEHMLSFLSDLHKYVSYHLYNYNELIWPLSMPCDINKEEDIILANYGLSNIANLKNIYRKGLKHRYGAIMQIITGVHYNFSLSIDFWKSWMKLKKLEDKINNVISYGYFYMIRNYYRFGWVIPYLFGASSEIYSSLLHGRNTSLKLERNGNILYMPYATSLRLSDLGYKNRSKNNFGITFNSLEDYIFKIKKAMHTKSEYFSALDKDKKNFSQQLNHNLLQIEDEFYAWMRPKRTKKYDESLIKSLLKYGVQYVEIRSLDINPFSEIGINLDQICFLDLFLIWCVLLDSPNMDENEFIINQNNWNIIFLEGRKKNQSIYCYSNKMYIPIKIIGERLLSDLFIIAEIFDSLNNNTLYQTACNNLLPLFKDSSLTYSAKLYEQISNNKDINTYGIKLSEKYHKILSSNKFKLLTETQLDKMVKTSILDLNQLEKNEKLTLSDYLSERLYL